MDGFRVFLQGRVNVEQALAALDAMRPVQLLDGPVGPVDMLCIRDDVFVELHREHQESDWNGLGLADFSLLARFVGIPRGASRAWIAAHAFFWVVTRRSEVTKALLVGPETKPLYFHGGRIRSGMPEQHHSEDA